VRKFFEEFGVEDKSIFIVTRVDGKPSGEAFAVFKDEEESRVAMQKLDKKKLGDRYLLT
jgi:RNA recognition motif-containing protein